MAYYKPAFDKTSFRYVYNSSENSLSVVAFVTADVKPREYLQVRPEFDSVSNTAKRYFNYIPGPSINDPVVVLDKSPVIVIPRVDVPYDHSRPDEFRRALRARYQLGFGLAATVYKPDGSIGGQTTDSIGRDADIEII